MKKQKKMSEKELTEFWANYTPPNPEDGEEFVEALKRGIAKQQREDAEAKKRKNQPPRP